MAYKQQQPKPTVGMKVSGGNRNALGLPLDTSGRREWSHGLCGCAEACGTFCYAYWCPCIVHGKNKQRMDHLQRKGAPDPHGGSCSSGACWAHCGLNFLAGLGSLLACAHRGHIRKRYNIEGGECSDCMVSCFCVPCELTQASREIELEEQSFRKRG